MAKSKKRQDHEHEMIQCQVCHRWFKRITPKHVATHGLTQDQYIQMYGPTTPNALKKAVAEGSATVRDLATAMSSDERLLAQLGGELRGYLFSDSRRAQIDTGLTLLMSRYLDDAERVQKAKIDVMEELLSDWRVTSGGENADPTPTSELISLLKAIMEVEDRASDMITDAARISVSERKNDAPLMVFNTNTEGDYTDEAERKVVFGDASQREAARNLVASMRAGDKAAIMDALYQKGSITKERYQSVTGREPPELVIDVDQQENDDEQND